MLRQKRILSPFISRNERFGNLLQFPDVKRIIGRVLFWGRGRRKREREGFLIPNNEKRDVAGKG